MLADAGADKSFLLTLNEWKADTYSATALIYNFELLMMGPGDTILARAVREGKDNLGGSAWNPPAHSRKAIPIAFQSKIEELFADPAIVKQLATEYHPQFENSASARVQISADEENSVLSH